MLRLNDIRWIEKYAPQWNTNINRTISISFRNDDFKVVPSTTTIISFICRRKIEGRTMHPTIVFLSSSSSAKINAIEQFAGIICLLSCLTTILWWLVFDQFQAAVIMVDPLKIFWVLTNSTYLGMSVCLWLYALYLRLSPLFFAFCFIYLLSTDLSFCFCRVRVVQCNTSSGLCTLFDWFAHSPNTGRCHCCGKSERNANDKDTLNRKMGTAFRLFYLLSPQIYCVLAEDLLSRVGSCYTRLPLTMDECWWQGSRNDKIDFSTRKSRRRVGCCSPND